MTSSAASINVADQSPGPYPWILHPVLDLLLCCGGILGLFCLLLFLAPTVFCRSSQIGQTIVIFSLITLSMPHGIASYLRVYNSAHTEKKVKVQATLLALVCAVAGWSTLVSDPAWFIFAHVTWYLGVEHLFKQSYGIALVYCYKRKYYLKKWEQKLFLFAVQMGTIHTVVAVFTGPDVRILNRSIGPPCLPAWADEVTQILLYVAIAAFAAVCLRKYKQEGKVFPLPAALCMFVSYCYQGALPFLVRDPVVAALAVSPNLHLTQYIAVTTAFHLKETGLPENVPLSKIASQLCRPVALKYFAFLLGAGFITSIWIIPQVWVLGMNLGFNIQRVAVAVFMVVNVHHYLVDALIWKQKDPDIRRLLIS
mgnify:CR=1 FL=1